MAESASARGERLEGTFEAVLNAAGPAMLDIAIHAGFIRIRAGEAGSVRVRGTLRGRRSLFGWGSAEERIRQLETNPPVHQEGSTIRIGDVTDRWLLRGVALFLEIAAPADTQVRALSDSGDIRVQDMGGLVDCEADSGDIEIAHVEGNVRASTDAGSIQVRQVKGRVYASSDAGTIEALDIAGGIEASADSGDITIVQTEAAPVRATSDSGRIKVKLAPEAGYTICTSTDGGEITLPELEWFEPISDQQARGRLRGGGPAVDLSTDSGDIYIR